MRIGRVIVWAYPALILAVGVGFLTASYFQRADADAYRRAPQCGNAVTSNCYEVFPGVIKSVQVSQNRSGERDAVEIQTEGAGKLTATLEPSDVAASHVRTGASVTVKRYRGQVTLVTVDGFNVASTANPAANQSDTASYGWFFAGLGVVSAASIVYSKRRKRRRRGGSALPTTDDDSGEILPSGSLGWSVRPMPNVAALARYGLVVVLIVFVTLRTLLDPKRTVWALTFDAAFVLVVVIALWLFYRNASVSADHQHIVKADLLGRTKSLPLREVKSAVRFSVASRYGTNKYLVFVGPDGRKAFAVAGIAWDFDRLDALCRKVGIQLGGSYDDLVSALKLNSRVPGTTNWTQTLLMAGGLFVVIGALVLLLIGPTQR